MIAPVAVASFWLTWRLVLQLAASLGAEALEVQDNEVVIYTGRDLAGTWVA